MPARTIARKGTIAGIHAVAASMLIAEAAHAEPKWWATPTYSTIDLTAGFLPDPWRQSLRAGGPDRVPHSLGYACTGYINDTAPDVDLNYTAGSSPLYIRVSAAADTTLVVLDPAGEWHCSDDVIGFDPIVAFDAPLDGNYNIWVGMHGESSVAPAELRISEIDPTREAAGTGQHPNWAAAPTYETVSLTSGFLPDPWRRHVQAGGSHDVGASVGGECVGYINASAPDIDLNYEAGSRTLHFHALSSADTTLAVLDPVGTWYCNDDAIHLDPVVTIRNPRSGNYNVWLGVRGSARYESAELRISEIDPR